MPDAVRRRLSTLDNWLNPYSWLATAVIVAIAAILRLVGLTSPKGYIFDEVYYPTDALGHARSTASSGTRRTTARRTWCTRRWASG